MKKLAVVLSLISFVVLAGCASQCNTCDQPAPAHHQDVKGEMK
jgi:hypothetical protein